jgi:methylmalonyl-CoA/ethylmalonyl-CoA epimerase
MDLKISEICAIRFLKNYNTMLEFHHIGNLVENIDEALQSYALMFGKNKVSEKFYISTQGVYVCFVEIAPERYLELIQPSDENSVVAKLAKKNIKYYHVGYWVKDIEGVIQHLTENNFKHLSTFVSEAFENRKCAFLFTPDGSLIELIEK